jgi:formylglycine-generating enzyme required for sulfatase activity
MNLYRHGFGWPKGNTDWGKFHGDPRERVYEGLPDPSQPGSGGNAISRTLTGSGPLSWSLNGKESGIWDLVGNCWEWCDLLVGANNTIDAGYPEAGTRLPASNGSVASLYAPAPDGEYSLGAEVFVPATLGSSNANYDAAYYMQASGQCAARRGGHWTRGADCSLASLFLSVPPFYTGTGTGFRGVC